jgi:hypothetical protein
MNIEKRTNKDRREKQIQPRDRRKVNNRDKEFIFSSTFFLEESNS